MARSFKIITTTAEFFAIRQEWNELLSVSGITSPFLRWEWQFQWWKNYGEPSANRQLAIVVARGGDRIVGILPGYICEHKNIYQKNTSFYLIGTEYESTDYLDIILSPGLQHNEICNELFSVALNRFPKVDLICCMNLLESNSLVRSMEQLASKRDAMLLNQHHRVCPYVIPAESWNTYLSKRSRNLRSNLKRKTRYLFEKQDVTFHILSRPEESDSAMAQLFRLHDLRFQQRKEESKFAKPLRKGFHFSISKQFAESNILRIYQLRKESHILATLYCFLYNHELFYFQAGMDPKWHKYSVGMVLMGKVLKHVHEEGYKRFDFMRGNEDYKYKWANDTRNMAVVYVATSPKGKRIIQYRRTYQLTKSSIRKFISDN